MSQQINKYPKTGPDPIGFYEYDEALVNLFTMKLYANPEDNNEYTLLKPTRAPFRIEFADQNSIKGTEEDNQKLNTIVKVPALALSQLNWDYDLTRWQYPHYRKLAWTEEGNRVVQSEQPIPVDIIYQLDVWTKYQAHMNQITRNILLKFRKREQWLEIDMKGVWGKRFVALSYLYSSPKNLTDLEPKDKDPKLRMAFSFILKAWILPDAVSVPSVRLVRESNNLAEEGINNLSNETTLIASTKTDLPSGSENP